MQQRLPRESGIVIRGAWPPATFAAAETVHVRGEVDGRCHRLAVRCGPYASEIVVSAAPALLE